MKLTFAIAATCCMGLAASAENRLHVYNWGEYIDPAVLEEFSDEFGIEVSYDTYTDSEATEAQLVVGDTGYDVVVVSSEYLQRLVSLEAVQKIDQSLLSNRGNLDPELMQRVQAFDHGSAYSVPYLWGTTGIGYNVNQVRDRMPDAPVKSWSMIFDPAVVSRFEDCGVAIVDSPEEVLSAALAYLGEDPNSKDPEVIQAGLDAIGQIAPHVRYFGAAQAPELAAGDLCVTLQWSGDVLAAIDEVADGVELEYSVPVQGAPIFFDLFTIPADAKNVDAAHTFINFLLRPDVIARVTNEVWYPNPNLPATALVDGEVLENKAVYPAAETMQMLYPVMSRQAKEKRNISRSWNRLKLGL